MSITDKFWAYFKPIAEGVAGVKYVQLSDAERMDRFRSDSLKKDVYPGVFVLRPKYRLADNGSGHLVAWFEVLFYVLAKSSNADWAIQDAAFSQCEAIGEAIAAGIKNSTMGKLTGFDLNTYAAEPVMYVTSDKADGYEIKMRVGVLVSDLLC